MMIGPEWPSAGVKARAVMVTPGTFSSNKPAVMTLAR